MLRRIAPSISSAAIPAHRQLNARVFRNLHQPISRPLPARSLSSLFRTKSREVEGHTNTRPSSRRAVHTVPPENAGTVRRARLWPHPFANITLALAASLAALYLLDDEKDLDALAEESRVNLDALLRAPGQDLPTLVKHGSKPRVVILGAGWASMGLLNALDPDLYEVIVISPRNYFLFTPMLPGTATGSVDARSVIEPVRRVVSGKPGFSFYELEATEVDAISQTVTAQDNAAFSGSTRKLLIPYDELIIAVGSVNNTFGTPGVEEHCYFLKQISDTARIRERILDLIEAACVPSTPKEELLQKLSFVVVGGGPTGVEFAAELHDFVQTEVTRMYPELAPCISIHIIQSADHILNNFDVEISKFAEKQFQRENINVITNARVTKIEAGSAHMTNKLTHKEEVLPFGFCLWATGVGPSDFVKNFCQKIPEQYNTKGIITDSQLRVKGVKHIFALGDCSTIEQTKLLKSLDELFSHADKDKDGRLSFADFKGLYDEALVKNPDVCVYGPRLLPVFREFDHDHKGLDTEALRKILTRADSGLKALPATAQVANQQGKWLADHLNRSGRVEDCSEQFFRYRYAGSLSYLGQQSAVAEVQTHGLTSTLTGITAWWAYRGIYFSKQVSFKNRFNLALDWVKCAIFGRDVSRF